MQCIITEKQSNQLAFRLPNLCNVSSQRNNIISLHSGFLITYAMNHHREIIKSACIEASLLMQYIITEKHYMQCIIIEKPSNQLALRLPNLCNVSSWRKHQTSLHWGFLTFANFCIITEKQSNQLAWRLLTLCNASSQRNNQISSHGGFLTYAMHNHRETIKSNLTYCDEKVWNCLWFS